VQDNSYGQKKSFKSGYIRRENVAISEDMNKTMESKGEEGEVGVGM
jgi:hypothetical protein